MDRQVCESGPVNFCRVQSDYSDCRHSPTTHSTQHTAHSTQHTAHSLQHTAHSTQHTAHSTQHTTVPRHVLTFQRSQHQRLSVLWDTFGDCDNYAVLPGHTGAIFDLCWSKDGGSVAPFAGSCVVCCVLCAACCVLYEERSACTMFLLLFTVSFTIWL